MAILSSIDTFLSAKISDRHSFYAGSCWARVHSGPLTIYDNKHKLGLAQQ